MTQKELEQKVIDAESRVAKREAVLKKHNSQLAKMIEKGADRFDVSIKHEDIKSATSKLAEARETLANWMDEEKRAKLLDLIGRIMSTVGTITDAATLYIGPEGDINGIIVGTEGKAKIQTIGAGGYNIQCFHFRTLIHEIK